MYFLEERVQSTKSPRSARPSSDKGSSTAYWRKKQLMQEKLELSYFLAKQSLEIDRKVELSRLRKLDPAYSEDNLPSELTDGILRELRDETSGYYGSKLYGKHIGDLERHDVARAMVLRDLPPRLFDPISLNLTQRALWDFSLDERKNAPFLTVSTRRGAFNWGQFVRGPLRLHLEDGRGWETNNPPTGYDAVRGDMKIELLVSGGRPVKLKLSVLSEERGLRWSLRGSSIYSTEHRELLSRLNAILDDYSLRLKWMEQYRDGWAVPRLSDGELANLRETLSIYYQVPSGALNPLKQRMLLMGAPERPMEIQRSGRAVRIHTVRCQECGRVARFDIQEQLYSGDSTNWTKLSELYIPTVPLEETEKILRRAHLASPCLKERSMGTNGRTGEAVAI